MAAKGINLPFGLSGGVAKVLLLLLCIVGVPFLIRIVLRQWTRIKETIVDEEATATYVENQNPQTVQSKADKITAYKNLQEAAASLAHDLGMMYYKPGSWWNWLDWHYWTENDAKAGKTLCDHPTTFTILSKLYYECYTGHQDLRADCVRLLDADTLELCRSKGVPI